VPVSFKPIRPLLQTGASAVSRWFSYIGLGIGVMLLLCSVQLFTNMQQLLTTSSVRKGGFDFISISKEVPDGRTMDRSITLFKPAEIEEIKKQPFVEEVAPLIANDFRVHLSAGSVLAFSTDFFLETVNHDFLDTIPPGFSWTEGQAVVPIIVAADFFDIYNVIFAPGQDLPQVSREMAYNIAFQISCSGNNREAVFVGKIVAFSERVNSILVPKTFLDWANREMGTGRVIDPGRIFIKTKDINDPSLLKFLDAKGYKVKKDSTLIGRNKILLQGVFSGLGIFGLLVVILALLLFSFYLQLVIARSRESLLLLITLGYSPAWLSRNVSRRFFPVYTVIIIVALLLTQLMNFFFYLKLKVIQPELSPFIHWGVLLLAVALGIFSIFTNYRMVKRLLTRITTN
jgi:hypothetical protein